MSYYGSEAGDMRRFALMTLWVIATDAFLKFLAHCANCVDPIHLDWREAARVYSFESAQCGANEVFGTPFELAIGVREGALFGIGSPAFSGLPGQVLGLALLAISAMVCIFVLRWKWRAHGDPYLLGALLGGAFIEAVPRLLSDGQGLTTFSVMGWGLHLGDVAIAMSAIWLASRAIGEARA